MHSEKYDPLRADIDDITDARDQMVALNNSIEMYHRMICAFMERELLANAERPIKSMYFNGFESLFDAVRTRGGIISRYLDSISEK